MAYEIFSRTRGRTPDADLRVKITSQGTLKLNRPGTSLLQEAGCERALLLWDKESMRIAIRPITGRDARSFRVRFQKDGKWASVPAKAFLEHVGFRGSGTFAASWNAAVSAIEVELIPGILNRSLVEPNNCVALD